MSLRNRMNRTVLAATAAVFSVISPSLAFADGIPCHPLDIFDNVDNNAVTVRCSAIQNGVEYISLSTSNAARADRFVSMANAALLSGMTFFVWTDNNPALKPAGCGASNCTRAVQFGLSKFDF